ncbi:Tn3 family transposase [Streptomyces sp. SCA2-4]|nr:Tn3 family transposase [Streptomyces huiliensis]MBZ4318777.1 Tn3 family transposase [Streptomyces huiliensis]
MEFVARQVQVPASELESYDWTGRTVEYHRAQIREHLGFRECSVADAEKLTAYLAEHVAHKERRPEQVREAVLRTGCLDAVTSVSGGGSLSPEVLAERLLLVIHAYGTNTGIKAVASGGHGHTEDELRYVRRRYLSAEAARAIAIQIANATFAARSTELWGQGSTAVASDSTHVRAYDQHLFTEWHSRYGGRGVLIYWHLRRSPWPSTPS